MAIGSDPEIGVKFTTWGDMNQASRDAWFEYIRTKWTVNLMAGYATIHPKPDVEAFNQKEGSNVTLGQDGRQ
jgi:hypothetical protein